VKFIYKAIILLVGYGNWSLSLSDKRVIDKCGEKVIWTERLGAKQQLKEI
jgi:hypothetical protein